MANIYTIPEIIETAVPIAKKYDLKKLALFGSYARNEATDHSDIDFLIDVRKALGLWRYADLVAEFELAFGTHVDVLDYDSIRDAFYGIKETEDVLAEEIVLYEE
jgi:predicted nucleotidyltransferase